MSPIRTSEADFPAPGSDSEKEMFYRLQAKLPTIYNNIAYNRQAPQTTVVVPSLSLDQEELSKIEGNMYYEERLLCMLMLLRRPRTRIVFLSSTKIAPIITQYYLSFLTGIPLNHAMRRLIMMDLNDPRPRPLTQKLLESPWSMDRLRKAIGDTNRAHLVVFNTTPFERTLAVRLGIPVYGTDPELDYLGSKSGCRRTLKQAGINVPDGYEDLQDTPDIVGALHNLRERNPGIKRAVVKLNEGFSGKGNALFDYRPIESTLASAKEEGERKRLIEKHLAKMKFEAKGLTWKQFERQFLKLEGIVEAFVEGEEKTSPSVQARVNAIGEPQVISTHDQILGGPTGQMFLGCEFPAHSAYRLDLQEDGRKVAAVLSREGVLGRFAVDFIVVKTETGYERYAIEINLRKGGTTHPFAMMKFLTEGHYDEESGLFLSSKGQEKYYYATDNLMTRYEGMGPEDLIDVMVFNNLHFHSYHQRGVAYHMIGALSQCGKLGITCIGNTRTETRDLHQRTIRTLELETTEAGRRDRLAFFMRAPQNDLDLPF